jgi:class 3 adenylate cyclase
VDRCEACGKELSSAFAFCPFCGAPVAAPVEERRKLATLLFCDMSGSTAMSEQVDAELVQELLRAYFREMRAAIEHHGGTLEKFIGDAVVAAFGLPEAHEDDALRACRAALEMQQRIVAVNEDNELRLGRAIAIRIGINTGEIVTGGVLGREMFATGDAVNTAARLEQAAGPGEVLLGEPTYALVRHSVLAEAAAPVDARGKAEPLAAHRLLGIRAREVTRRVGTPFTGREGELRLLQREYATVVSRSGCRLVTVVGEPGVGKSRLTREFVAQIPREARVVRGTCLPYGSGITFWAIGEIVRGLAGIDDEHSAAEATGMIEARVEGVENGSVVAANLAQLLGVAEGSATAPEIAWAIRHYLVAEARAQPLVVLVDDIHWGETALLDLLAELPSAIAEAGVPVLLLCLGRPELLDSRPEWPVTLRLEPLNAREEDSLLQSLLGEVSSAVLSRLAHHSAGNPLFAEELVAMLLEEGVLRIEAGVCFLQGALDQLALPASLHALLGARLDQLDHDARTTLQRASVEGEVFHQGAVVDLTTPDSRPLVAALLDGLSSMDLVRPTESSFVDDEAFRFKHILVRDAAYLTTPKKLRAALHEQFAVWLERVAGDRVAEYDEILGHHLEESHRLRAELGPLDDKTQALGVCAGLRLAAAGHRADDRGDLGAVTNLLGRAAALLPRGSRERIEVVLVLVEALADFVRVAEAEALLEEVGEAALTLGDERLVQRVKVEQAWLVIHANAVRSAEGRVLAEAEQALATFERLGDDLGASRALEVIATVHLYYGRMADLASASEQGYIHAERAHDTQAQGKHRLGRMAADHWGATPFDQADSLLDDHLAWARRNGSLGVEAKAMVRLGLTRAMRGDRLGGNELFARGMAACAEIGAKIWSYQELGSGIWALTDDPEIAEA